MCVNFLSKFARSLSENDIDMKPSNIELELLKACKAAKGKDERFVSSSVILYELRDDRCLCLSAIILEQQTYLLPSW